MYLLDEQETTLIYDVKLKRWKAYTCYPSHILKLTRKAGEPHKIEIDSNGRIISATWFLTKRQISFLSADKPKKKITHNVV